MLRILLVILFIQSNDYLMSLNSDHIEKKEYRVSYIYFNGKEISLNDINELRKKIIQKYNYGVNFSVLAKEYSMDGNSEKGGDLGWFPEGRMHPQFEKAIKNHKKGDIFTVDIPSRDWYYVVLKTYSDRDS